MDDNSKEQELTGDHSIQSVAEIMRQVADEIDDIKRGTIKGDQVRYLINMRRVQTNLAQLVIQGLRLEARTNQPQPVRRLLFGSSSRKEKG